MKTQKKWILITAAILLCIAAALTALFCLNQYSMELNIPDKTITLEYGVMNCRRLPHLSEEV